MQVGTLDVLASSLLVTGVLSLGLHLLPLRWGRLLVLSGKTLAGGSWAANVDAGVRNHPLRLISPRHNRGVLSMRAEVAQPMDKTGFRNLLDPLPLLTIMIQLSLTFKTTYDALPPLRHGLRRTITCEPIPTWQALL